MKFKTSETEFKVMEPRSIVILALDYVQNPSTTILAFSNPIRDTEIERLRASKHHQRTSMSPESRSDLRRSLSDTWSDTSEGLDWWRQDFDLDQSMSQQDNKLVTMRTYTWSCPCISPFYSPSITPFFLP